MADGQGVVVIADQVGGEQVVRKRLEAVSKQLNKVKQKERGERHKVARRHTDTQRKTETETETERQRQRRHAEIAHAC
eukprot:1491-Rhodomonas_salina.2